jgi:peptidoglycan-associated lipoprotein
MVAKAEPDAAGRRMEGMRQEELAAASAALKDVFFAFDSWKITEEGKEALARDAEWLKTNSGLMLSVEGYCDERGTQAYNLVLGEKRAKAVRNYLAELGVGAERMAVTSYGKERPFCQGHDEACYRLNRRAHLALRAQ